MVYTAGIEGFGPNFRRSTFGRPLGGEDPERTSDASPADAGAS